MEDNNKFEIDDFIWFLLFLSGQPENFMELFMGPPEFVSLLHINSDVSIHYVSNYKDRLCCLRSTIVNSLDYYYILFHYIVCIDYCIGKLMLSVKRDIVVMMQLLLLLKVHS